MVLQLAEPHVEDKILEVFEEDDIIHFPVRSQKDARAFVKALHSKGVKYDMICEEIGEHEPNFDSWRKSLGRTGIGQRVIEWINQPLYEILESDDDEEEFVENLRQKMRKKSENGTASANDKDELHRKQQQLREQRLKEEKEKQEEERRKQEKEDQERREQQAIDRQEREERERQKMEDKEKKEKEDRLARERQREEERERQQRYEAEQKQARELEKKRKEEEKLQEAELERQRQEEIQKQKQTEEIQQDVQIEDVQIEDVQEKEEEEEEDNEIIFQIKSAPEEAEEKSLSVQERLQAFEVKSEKPSNNHIDCSSDGSQSPKSEKDSPKATHSPKQITESNQDTPTEADDPVDENYNSDLDPDNTNQSPVLSTLVKKISAMRSSNKNGLGYVYILSDSDESAENKQVKVGISRFPEKRLLQAQLFNPDLWMVRKFSVSQRVTAINECYDGLHEYRISDNTKGWFIGTYAEMENIVSEVASKYPSPKLEKQDSQEESEC